MRGFGAGREIHRRSARRRATPRRSTSPVLERHRARARLTVSIFRESARARQFLAVLDAQAIRHIRCARSWRNAQARVSSSLKRARDDAREEIVFFSLFSSQFAALATFPIKPIRDSLGRNRAAFGRMGREERGPL